MSRCLCYLFLLNSIELSIFVIDAEFNELIDIFLPAEILWCFVDVKSKVSHLALVIGLEMAKFTLPLADVSVEWEFTVSTGSHH